MSRCARPIGSRPLPLCSEGAGYRAGLSHDRRCLHRRQCIFEVLSSFCLPLVKCFEGTKPGQVAKSRPCRNCPIGDEKISTARAVTGPTPGMVCNRRGMSASVGIAAIRPFNALIRLLRCATWSKSIRQVSKANSGSPFHDFDHRGEARQ